MKRFYYDKVINPSKFQTNQDHRRLAEGVLFSTGFVAVRWYPCVNYVMVYTSLKEMQAVQRDQDGKAVVVWID